MAKGIIVVVRQPKSNPDDWKIVGQTTDEDHARSIISGANDNDTFVKKSDGTIAGNNSVIEAFDKNDLGSAFSKTEDI